MNNIVSHIRFAKLLRIALGSALAILLADMLGLKYSASAGIITLLTIQNTKRETIAIAMKRILSFGLALVLAYLLFTAMGFHALVFGLFLLVFVGLSELLGLPEGISISAVLTTHFLIEKTMDLSLIGNEIWILLIGMGIGIGLNLMIRQPGPEVTSMIHIIDDGIRDVLRKMASFLMTNEGLPESIVPLHHRGEEVLAKIRESQNNALRSDFSYYVSYCEMRINQINALDGMLGIMKQLTDIPAQAQAIAGYLTEIADSYHETNDVLDLFQKYEDLYQMYQKSELPQNRNDFEQRARLFHILIMSKQFLLLKREFVEHLNTKQKESFRQEKL